jgi:hypothetical protein
MSKVWRAATLHDVQTVLGDLSAVSRDEMKVCGLSKAEVLWMARSHWLHCGRAFVFLQDATPVAVFGLSPQRGDPEVLNTWLISSPRFHTAAWTLFSRKFLAHLQAQHPNQRLLTTTYSKRSTVNRWFQLLGFEMLDKAENHKVFEYVARNVDKTIQAA